MRDIKGLTLVEVLVTLAIIGMVAAIAIPPMVRFREEATEKVCRANLKTIDNAKLEWAVENNQSNDAEPTEEDLASYIRGEFPQPVVAGALYKIGSLLTPALCSYHGNHSINGFGMTVPKAMVELVKAGKLTGTDVVGGYWRWRSIVGGSRFDKYECYPTSYGVGKRCVETIEMGSTPVEININGKTLKGESITRYSKGYLEGNKEYYQRGYESSGGRDVCAGFNIQRDKGGYDVSNWADDTYTEHYYDHKADLIGYEHWNHGEVPRSHRCWYDGKGNILYEQIWEGGGVVTYITYDGEGNIVEEITP